MQIVVFKLVLVLVAAISYRIRTNNLQSNTICFDFFTPWLKKWKQNIYSAHVLISIIFAVFEYLDTTLATENKILRFSRAVVPHETRSSNVNLALILCFSVSQAIRE